MELDLNAIFETGTRAMNDDRGDGARPHLGGDVAGICDRQGWERRFRATNNLPPLEYETATLKLFARGHAIEKMILDRIEAGLPAGLALVRNEVVVYRGCVGHIDAAIYRIVDLDIEDDRRPFGRALKILDVKSTVWWQTRDEYNRITWVPKEVRDTACMQLAAYSIAKGNAVTGQWTPAEIFEYDVASDGTRVTPVDIEEYRSAVERRVDEVLARTNPAKPPPPAEPLPGAEWACGSVARAKNKVTGEYDQIIKKAYCNNTGCPRHVSNAEVSV